MTPAGVLVVDKPRGPTSHDVVARVRRTLKTREVGHAGTLDPMATGVLVVAVGEATKLVPWLTAHDKAYETTLKLGVATSTLDAEGEVVEEQPVDDATFARLDEAIAGERARTEQVPPAVSAIKIDGVAAHARVRRGEVVELAPRTVAVRALEVVAIRRDAREIDLRVHTAKGYYVRSLARDLAARLGTVAHLVALRRTQSGPFTLDDAVPLDEIAAPTLGLAAAATRALGAVTLTSAGTLRARQGKRLAPDDFVVAPTSLGEPRAWLDGDGTLVAVGEMVAREAEGEPALEGRVIRGFRAP